MKTGKTPMQARETHAKPSHELGTAKKTRLIVGLRAYTVGPKEKELERQLADARKAFPDAHIAVTICGTEPSVTIRKSADHVEYLGPKAVGILESWRKLLSHARNREANELVMVDGDEQHILANVRAAYDQAKGICVPQRENRVVFTSDVINGVALEGLENAFFYEKWRADIPDIQSGVVILKDATVIRDIDLDRMDARLGDLGFFDALFRLGGGRHPAIDSPRIAVRPQAATVSSRALVFDTVHAYEAYFGIRFEDLIRNVKSNPGFYHFNSPLSALESIELSYANFQNAKKIKNIKGLILAGGKGTNLRPLTHTLQKQLVPVANKPIIFYIIEDLVNAGIDRIGIIVGPNKHQVMETVGDGRRWGARITFIEQEKPAGLADAVRTAKPYLDQSNFIMYLGDNLVKGGIGRFVTNFVSQRNDARIMMKEVPDPQRFGVVQIDSERKIVRVVEKPKVPPSNLAIVGIYAFTPAVHEAIAHIRPSARNEWEITDAIQWMIEQRKTVVGEPVLDWWTDTGKPDALLEANQLVLDELKSPLIEATDIPESCRILGRVKIGAGTKLGQEVTIRGPAVIGKDCIIGPNACIGPYTSIGNGVHFSEAEIENSIVLDGTRIHARRRIVDSLIAHHCDISQKAPQGRSGEQLILGEHSKIIF